MNNIKELLKKHKKEKIKFLLATFLIFTIIGIIYLSIYMGGY